MRNRDLHILPKLRDGLGFLYLERGIIEQSQKAVQIIDKEGRTQIPVASLAALLLGPGTSITHEAVKRLTDNGCSILWTGEEGVRFYAQGNGETRKAGRLLHQARLVSDPVERLRIVRRMYEFRFEEELDADLSIQQIRGLEGVRVRSAYAEASRTYGVPWNGRRYHRGYWGATDSINRALSAANACLNGLCHAAIVSVGYSPGLGFIHTGKLLSFVYDIADLYKAEITIPLAFQLTAESTEKLESRVRHACRDAFYEKRLLARLLPDMDLLLEFGRTSTSKSSEEAAPVTPEDQDPAFPGGLWSPGGVPAPGGTLYLPDEEAGKEVDDKEVADREQEE